jgi:hypothetical protein
MSTQTSANPSNLHTSKTPGKRKANDLLRNYYGLGQANGTTNSSSSSSSSHAQRLDPDSKEFEPQAAFQSLLQESSLSQLLKSESDLLTEIRELDGERQSLVYNHHHELVAASETIGKVSKLL